MPKSVNQKLKLVVLINIFERLTDEDHPLNANELIKELEKYEIKAERKSIYSDVEQLTQYGYDIVYTKARVKQGYYLASRKFELPELKLLVDLVLTSRFITQKKSRDLVAKLETMCSKYEEIQLKRQVFVLHRIKTENESIYYNVDEIYNGIMQNKKISFYYLEWNDEKKQVKKRDGKRYFCSPFALTWNEGNYYLIAFDDEKDTIRHYRVDKMKQIELSKEERKGKDAFANFDLPTYCNKTFGMYGGTTKTITLQFPERLIGVMIDRFGTDLSLRKMEDGTISTRVEVAISNQFYGWVAGIGKEMKVISPKDVKENYIQYLKEILNANL